MIIRKDNENFSINNLRFSHLYSILLIAVSQIIQNHPNLVEKNFSIHYQHGRIGYMDLDAFAKSVDLEKLVKAKEENSIDKNEE